jgi:hypothetical protein
MPQRFLAKNRNKKKSYHRKHKKNLVHNHTNNMSRDKPLDVKELKRMYDYEDTEDAEL